MALKPCMRTEQHGMTPNKHNHNVNAMSANNNKQCRCKSNKFEVALMRFRPCSPIASVDAAMFASKSLRVPFVDATCDAKNVAAAVTTSSSVSMPFHQGGVQHKHHKAPERIVVQC